MKIRSLLALILLLPVVQSLHAQTLDLTKGFGKYTWGMSFDDALKIANTTYGEANVHSSLPLIHRTPILQPNPPGLPSNFPPMQRLIRSSDQPPNDLSAGITVNEDAFTLSLGFFHGRLYVVSKSVKLELKGFVTRNDLDAAGLTDRVKTQIKVSKGIVLGTNFSANGETDYDGTSIFGGGVLTFTAVNNDVFNAEVAKLRGGNPDLDALFVTPLLTP